MATAKYSQQPLLSQKSSRNEESIVVEPTATRIVFRVGAKREVKECCILLCKIILLCGGVVVSFFLGAAFIPWLTENFFIRVNVGRSSPKFHTENERAEALKLIEQINSHTELGWKAKYYPFAHSSIDYPDIPESGFAKFKFDAIGTLTHAADSFREAVLAIDRLEDTVEHLKDLMSTSPILPTHFDARIKWALCSSLHQIHNQGACGSCWAMAATTVMSDRMCISSNYTKQDSISTQDLLSCCTECGSCGGGSFPISGFSHWKRTGLVTGGDYRSNEGCRPYEIDNDCGYPCDVEYYERNRTPRCRSECHPLYTKNYTEDVTRASKAYWLLVDSQVGNTVKDWRFDELRKIDNAMKTVIDHHPNLTAADLLKRELINFGPIMACFSVTEDFLHYGSGIYHRSEWSDNLLYSHCMKLLGWGEERGREYWIYANSWGRNWGENGFMRIALSDIPEDAVAGIY